MVAEWKDSINKRTKLNYSTIYPTNFDKQKVQSTLNVFDEKTVGVLTNTMQTGTTIFVNLVTRLINILKVKSPKSGYRLNDREIVMYLAQSSITVSNFWKIWPQCSRD